LNDPIARLLDVSGAECETVVPAGRDMPRGAPAAAGNFMRIASDHHRGAV